MKKIIAMAAAVAAMGAHAAQERVKIPSDPKAVYTIIERSGTGKIRQIVTKREGPSGVNFQRREYDCDREVARDYGSGDTLELMEKNRPKKMPKWFDIYDGSIVSWVGGIACHGYYRKLKKQ